jgi:outer membrane protein, multidrug efflux system
MRKAAALSVALVSSACSFVPRYERPAAPVAEQFPVASPAAGEPAAAMGWRDVFADPRLQALVGLALENNRDLRVAALNVELTQAQYRIQRAGELPSLAATASSNTQRVPADLSPTAKATQGTAYSVGAAASFELDLWGRVRSLSQAALEQYFATDEARRSAQLSLVAAVATQYLANLAFDDQVALARQTLDTVQASYALNQRTYEAGRASELDLRTAEAQVRTAEFNLSVAQQQRAQAENALVLLVGQPIPSDLPPARPLDAAAVTEVPAGLPSEVLTRRPDVLSAEHALLSANASIGAARAAFFPSISLTAFGGTSSASLTGLFGGGSGTWSFAPRLTLPLFQGGALRASLDVAEVRKSIQVAQYERAVQQAFREVSDALVTRAKAEEQLADAAARVEAEQRRYYLSDVRYRKGVDSYLNVLTAQRDLFAAQQQLIQSRLTRLTNLVDLYRALGGGWRETTEGATARNG